MTRWKIALIWLLATTSSTFAFNSKYLTHDLYLSALQTTREQVKLVPYYCVPSDRLDCREVDLAFRSFNKIVGQDAFIPSREPDLIVQPFTFEESPFPEGFIADRKVISGGCEFLTASIGASVSQIGILIDDDELSCVPNIVRSLYGLELKDDVFGVQDLYSLSEVFELGSEL